METSYILNTELAGTIIQLFWCSFPKYLTQSIDRRAAPGSMTKIARTRIAAGNLIHRNT